MPGHVGEIRFNVGDLLFELSGIEIVDKRYFSSIATYFLAWYSANNLTVFRFQFCSCFPLSDVGDYI